MKLDSALNEGVACSAATPPERPDYGDVCTSSGNSCGDVNT
jgi:hypothetical protein